MSERIPVRGWGPAQLVGEDPICASSRHRVRGVTTPTTQCRPRTRDRDGGGEAARRTARMTPRRPANQEWSSARSPPKGADPRSATSGHPPRDDHRPPADDGRSAPSSRGRARPLKRADLRLGGTKHHLGEPVHGSDHRLGGPVHGWDHHLGEPDRPRGRAPNPPHWASLRRVPPHREPHGEPLHGAACSPGQVVVSCDGKARPPGRATHPVRTALPAGPTALKCGASLAESPVPRGGGATPRAGATARGSATA